MKMKFCLSFLFVVLSIVIAFSQELKVGDALSNIKVQEINNGVLTEVNLAQLTKNKIVIVEFWDTYCGPCIDGFHHLKALQEKFQNDLVVIGVSKLDYDKTIGFIKEYQFPFHFLFEKQNELSMLFPHNSIPHSIVIDKKGIIQNITSPSYLTEEVIANLINNKISSLPLKIANQSDQNKTGLNGLLVFNFKRAGLDDDQTMETTLARDRVQFVNGYKANSFRDTIQNIQKLKLTGMNAVELYQVAYNNLPKNHFIYPQSIKWIKSNTPDNLFNLEYSVSSLLPNSNYTLQKQLDLMLGLHSFLVERDTTVFVIKQILPNDSTIKIRPKVSSNQTGPLTYQTKSTYNYKHIKFESEYGTEQDLARLLEDKLGIPVVCRNSEQDIKYQFKLNMINEGEDLVDEWLKILKNTGIILEKEIRKVTYLKVEPN